MAQILIIDNDKQLTTVLKAKLEKLYSCDVIIRESASEALSLLQILSDVNLLLTKDQLGKEQTANKIFDQLTNNKEAYPHNVPLLILGANKTGNPGIRTVDKSASLEFIAKMAAFMMGLAPEPEVEAPPKVIPKIQTPAPAPVPAPDQAPAQAPAMPTAAPQKPLAATPVIQDAIEYVSINTHLLLSFIGQPFPFETFTRTKKKEKGYEYNIKIPGNAIIEEEGIQRLITRGVAELYVYKDVFIKKQADLNNVLIAKLNDASISAMDRLEINSWVFTFNLDLLKYGLINAETARIVKENATAQKNLIKNSSNVFALFENGRKIKELSYGYCHSFLTNTLLNKCLQGMDWYTEEMADKIFLMTYFHDLSLHNDKLIKGHHHYFMEHPAFSADETNIVLSHALLSSDIFSKLNLGGPDLVPLIKEHHGIKSGKGFAETLSIIISPFSMCFLTIEEFVTRYLDLGLEFTPVDIQAIFVEMEKKFVKLTYDHTLKKLRTLYK